MATSYFHFDAQGTTRTLTDSSQTATDSYIHDAFGNQRGSNGTTANPFRYVGQKSYYRDADSGTMNVRARTYQPTITRWQSEDRIGFASGDANLYRYVRNSPTNRVDPKGLADLGEYFGGKNGFNPQEKELWKTLDTKEKCCMKRAYDTALELQKNPAYKKGWEDGPGDAMRHCVFSCEMTRCLGVDGEKRAKEWGDAHELNPNREDSRKMDLENNANGRLIGAWVPSRTCEQGCAELLGNGRLTLLPEDRWINSD